MIRSFSASMADSFFLGVDGGPTATWCDSHETWTEAEVDGAFSRQPCKFTDLQEPDQEDDEDERTALPSMTATMEGCVACGGGYCSCRVAAPAAAVPSLALQFSRGGSEYMWGMNVITGETLQSKKENRQADEDESPPIPFPVRRADSDAAAAALRREEPRAPERGPSRDALPVGTSGQPGLRFIASSSRPPRSVGTTTVCQWCDARSVGVDQVAVAIPRDETTSASDGQQQPRCVEIAEGPWRAAFHFCENRCLEQWQLHRRFPEWREWLLTPPDERAAKGVKAGWSTTSFSTTSTTSIASSSSSSSMIATTMRGASAAAGALPQLGEIGGKRKRSQEDEEKYQRLVGRPLVGKAEAAAEGGAAGGSGERREPMAWPGWEAQLRRRLIALLSGERRRSVRESLTFAQIVESLLGPRERRSREGRADADEEERRLQHILEEVAAINSLRVSSLTLWQLTGEGVYTWSLKLSAHNEQAERRRALPELD